MQPRIVINQVVSWQGSDCQPKSIPSLFSRFLDSDEEPLTRLLKAYDRWTLVDTAWITASSSVVISNEWGKRGNAQPTASSSMTAPLLNIIFSDLAPAPDAAPHCVVYPQESLRVTPFPGQRIWVCVDRAKECKYSIAVFPR